MQILKYYDNPLEANIDCELLQAQGITAVVLNENTCFVLPITLANPNMRPCVAVSREDASKAAEILNELHDDHAL